MTKAYDRLKKNLGTKTDIRKFLGRNYQTSSELAAAAMSLADTGATSLDVPTQLRFYKQTSENHEAKVAEARRDFKNAYKALGNHLGGIFRADIEQITTTINLLTASEFDATDEAGKESLANAARDINTDFFSANQATTSSYYNFIINIKSVQDKYQQYKYLNPTTSDDLREIKDLVKVLERLSNESPFVKLFENYTKPRQSTLYQTANKLHGDPGAGLPGFLATDADLVKSIMAMIAISLRDTVNAFRLYRAMLGKDGTSRGRVMFRTIDTLHDTLLDKVNMLMVELETAYQAEGTPEADAHLNAKDYDKYRVGAEKLLTMNDRLDTMSTGLFRGFLSSDSADKNLSTMEDSFNKISVALEDLLELGNPDITKLRDMVANKDQPSWLGPALSDSVARLTSP